MKNNYFISLFFYCTSIRKFHDVKYKCPYFTWGRPHNKPLPHCFFELSYSHYLQRSEPYHTYKKHAVPLTSTCRSERLSSVPNHHLERLACAASVNVKHINAIGQVAYVHHIALVCSADAAHHASLQVDKSQCRLDVFRAERQVYVKLICNGVGINRSLGLLYNLVFYRCAFGLKVYHVATHIHTAGKSITSNVTAVGRDVVNRRDGEVVKRIAQFLLCILLQSNHLAVSLGIEPCALAQCCPKEYFNN